MDNKEKILKLLLKKAAIKKALADIRVGDEIEEKADKRYGVKYFDYNHVLPEEMRNAGYGLVLKHQSIEDRWPENSHYLEMELYHKNDGRIGALSADVQHRYIEPMVAEIKHTEHRGKGLGFYMYEALFAHAKNYCNVTHVSGGVHSTMASKVHQKLAKVHGMNYEPRPFLAGQTKEEWEQSETGPFDDRYNAYKYALKSELSLEDLCDEDNLEKNLASILASAMIAMAPGGGTPDAKPAVVQNVWTPAGLHDELHPIAHLESSFGKNVNHYKSKKGSWDTAVGAVGLKPMTAHEEYLRRPELKKKFPGLESAADFEESFKTNHKLYNAVASEHWKYLRKRAGSAAKAAFAWRFGLGAAQKASDEEINSAEYVKKYLSMLKPMVSFKKSEEEDGD